MILTACSAGASDDYAEDSEDGFVIEDGKADDFLSLKAREFIVTGTGRVVVPAGSSDAAVKKAIVLQHTGISWFLNQYLVDKEKEGHSADANADYGGFSAMVKDGAYEDLEIVKRNETTYDFKFEQVIAGKRELMSNLPLNARNEFSVEVGNPTLEEMQSDPEWYRQAPWDAWDPSKVADSKKTTITFAIRQETKSSDGWWDYKRLFEDGTLTVDAHFGWDYNAEAAHLVDSKLFYEWLLDHDFKSPVSSWDKYTRTSGPLTRTLDADGQKVKVEVRIFYPRPGTATDPDTDAGGKLLEKDMFASLSSRDVIVYSGHSGPFYGFSMANWDKTEEGDIDDVELAVADLPTDRYQIVMAEACNTYMLGHTLMTNPHKAGKNIDVITTTDMSVSYSPVEDFMTRLLEIDTMSRHRPRTISATIADLDMYTTGSHQPTMYGVHGIDDNPKVHPYAHLENACKKCSANSDCGGVGNACVTVGDSGRRCVAACTDDSGCQDGYQCKSVASASTSTIYGSYCVPATRSCE